VKGFLPTPDRPVHTLSRYFKDNFGGRVRKIALDAGFSCPNRIGPGREGGCFWCDPSGSGPGGDPGDWESRLKEEASKLLGKGFVGGIAYLQAFTGTFGESAELRKKYEKALAVEGVLGLAVGTRPDCLDPETLGMLEDVGRARFLWVEIGMQTMHDATLLACNRGHSHQATVAAAEELRKRGIKTVLHLIAGLPGESGEMIRRSFGEAVRLDPWGIKLHPFHIVKGSEFGKRFEAGRGPRMMELQEYAELAASLIEMAAPETVFHRLTGERPEGILLAPRWCQDKNLVRKEILARLAASKGFQGRARLRVKPCGD